MAMRPAAAGWGVGRQAAAGVQPVYVDFKPVFEWKQEREVDMLLVYLPGFLKQNLKVSTEGQNVVRARGERLDAGNRWSRFQEDYLVPERCDIRAIRARFEGGVLTITMPWTKDWIQHQSQVPDAQNQTPDLNTSVPRTLSPPKQIPQEPEKIRPEKETNNAPMPSLPAQDKKALPQKGSDSNGTSRINNDAYMKKLGESVQNIGKPANNLDTSGFDDRKINPKEDKENAGLSTSSDDHGLRNYKEAVKSLAELKEERQLLVNVGAAVLVIVALGTYMITSRLASSDDY